MLDISFETLKNHYDSFKKIKIYPYVWRNGFTNLSEKGYVDNESSPNNYLFYQKYANGSPLVATWEGSTSLSPYDTSKGEYRYTFTAQNGENAGGKWFEAVEIPPTECSLDIGKNENNDAFIRMQDEFEIDFLVYNNEFTVDDLYKPYMIPTRTGMRILFLFNFQILRNPQNQNELITKLIFVSSKDKLITSGKAQEQFIHLAAPGEPYAYPEEQPNGTVVVSNNQGQHPEGVRYINIELQAGSAFAGALIYGRKLSKDQYGRWISSSPMILFPSRMVIAAENDLNKTGSNSQNYYCFDNETVETRSSQDFQEAIKQQDSALAPLKNQGVFTLGLKSEYENNSLIHKSNPAINGLRKSIVDSTWKPFDYKDENWSLERDSSGCILTTDKNTLYKTDTVPTILAKNALLYMAQPQLNLDYNINKPYRIGSIPLLGKINSLYGDFRIFDNRSNIKLNSLCYFVDCSLAQNSLQQFTQPNDDNNRQYGNLQNLCGENAPKGSCITGLNTSIAFELSDKFIINGETFSTEILGQTKDKDGDWINQDHSPYYLDTNNSTFEPVGTNETFIIDSIQVFALSECKIKVSCYGAYSNNQLRNPLFTQTMLSSSLFETENIRNWMTPIKFGGWNSIFVNGTTEWPQEPYKSFSGTKVFPINKTSKMLEGTSGGWGSASLVLGHWELENDVKVYHHNNNWTSRIVYENDYFYVDSEEELEVSNYYYADLFQAPDKTKDDFINEYEQILIDVSGSQTGWFEHWIFHDQEWMCKLNNGSLSIPLEAGKYLYEGEIGVVAFNCDYDTPLKNISVNSGSTLLGLSQAYERQVGSAEGEPIIIYEQGPMFNDGSNGGFSYNLKYRLELIDDRAILTLWAVPTFYGYSRSFTNNDINYFTSTLKPQLRFGLKDIPRNNDLFFQFAVNLRPSYIQLNKITLIKK